MSESTNRWNEPVLAPTEVKRQHYIPRVYLRAFADGSEQVRVVDFETGRQYRTSVDNTAVEARFNNVQVGDDVVSTEGWLSGIEGAAAPIIERLRDDPSEINSLDDQEQMQLARFFAAMRFRVPAFREQSENLRDQIATFAKGVAGDMLRNTQSPDTAARIWAEWENKPNEWWFQETEPFATSELAASMLAGVQGFANLFWAMPWWVGRVPAHSRLYTSDNPVSGHLPPIHPWWEGGAFASLDYYIPLSPSILFKISRRPYQDAPPVGTPGGRISKDFSDWHVGMALQVTSANASRFLYGDGPINDRNDARRDLAVYEQRAVLAAKMLLGHSDRPPQMQMPDGMP